MLDYIILNRKSQIKKFDKINNKETNYIDLLSGNFKDIYGDCKIYIVEKYYVARPDLISLAIYKTDKYADIICKVNGISNPFEIDEGMVLAIPNIEHINESLKNIKSIPCELIKNDDNIVKKPIEIQKKKNERRSSDEQLIGDTNFIIDRTNNIIFY